MVAYAKITAALVLASCLALPGLAQKETPPPGGQPKNFVLPAQQTFSLDNGLAVTLVQYGDVPKVTVELALRTGNIDEAAAEVWLADLTGELMKEGTTTRSARELAGQAAAMGGQINVSVGPDQTTVSGDALSDFAAAVVELVADVALNPRLPESEIERLKTDQKRNLSIEKSVPQSQALEKFRAVLYHDHPYGRIFPTEAMIDSYTIDRVRSFYRNHFGAGRSRLYVAGRFDPAAVEQAIRTHFGAWEKGSAPVGNVPSPSSSRRVYLLDRPGAPQSTLYLGLPVVDPTNPDWTALSVTNTLLGGFFSSRITTNIREDKGYTYSPRSSLSVRLRDAYWIETADVTTEVTGASLKEIFYEIDRLQAEAPEEQELQGIKNYLAGTFVVQNSQRDGIIGQLSYIDLHGLGIDYLNGYVQRVMAVSPQQVQEMAQKYLRDQDMTIVVVGDKSKVTGQLAGYGDLVSN